MTATPSLSRAIRAAAIAAGTAIVVAGCGDTKTTTVTVTTPGYAPTVEETADPNPDPNRALLASYKCDSVSDPDAFVASLRIRNQGNVGLRVWSFARWDQPGGEPVTSFKSIQLRPDQSRIVRYRVEATSDQIRAHQSAKARCSVHSQVVGTLRRGP